MQHPITTLKVTVNRNLDFHKIMCLRAENFVVVFKLV